MQTITVNQPRAIVIGKHILFPGKNVISPEFAKEIEARPGTMKALDMFARARVITFNAKEGKVLDTSDSLVGLDEPQAVALIESTKDKDTLERWAKKAKGKTKAAIDDQLAILKMEKGGS